MRIGIDIRSFVEGKRTGVEEYIMNLLDNLFKIDRINEYRLFCNAYKNQSLDLDIFKKFGNVKIYKFNIPNKILNLSFRFLNYPKIDKMLGQLDLFFAPNIMFFGLSSRCKLVLTLHDLSFEYHKNFLTPYRRFWHASLNPKKLCVRANKIICPSHSTKNDLIKTYKIPAEKIEVIHWGINQNFKKTKARDEKMKAKFTLPEKFILFLGTFEPRKNIIGVLKAYSILKSERDLPHKLVLTGSPGWKDKKIFKFIKEKNLQKEILSTDFVNQEDKEKIFRRASLFVYPSFYEGFGFPPLEAMSFGCPVIASAASSLPEICQNAALLVNPYNVKELSEAMYQVLFDEKLRDNLIKKGNEQVKKFRWEETARRTLHVFKNC